MSDVERVSHNAEQQEMERRSSVTPRDSLNASQSMMGSQQEYVQREIPCDQPV